ncbi:hypothetical protein ACP6JB_006161 [Aspergillus fumigatus]
MINETVTTAFPTAHHSSAKDEFTARCANAPTKHPAVSITRNSTRRVRGRLCTLNSPGSTTTSTYAAVAMAVVISVIFSDRLIATCAPDENAKHAMTPNAAGPSCFTGSPDYDQHRLNNTTQQQPQAAAHSEQVPQLADEESPRDEHPQAHADVGEAVGIVGEAGDPDREEEGVAGLVRGEAAVVGPCRGVLDAGGEGEKEKLAFEEEVFADVLVQVRPDAREGCHPSDFAN